MQQRLVRLQKKEPKAGCLLSKKFSTLWKKIRFNFFMQFWNDYVLIRRCFVYKNIVVMLFMTAMLAVTACSEEETSDTSHEEKAEALSEDPADVKTYEYRQEVGCEFETLRQEAATVLDLEGEVAQANSLNEPYVWARIRKKEQIEGVNDQTMDYFIPLEEGRFKEE